jgi:hypothetical protein
MRQPWVGTGPLPRYGGMHSSGFLVQTVVLTETSTSYRYAKVSSASRKSPFLPYSSSAVIQSR